MIRHFVLTKLRSGVSEEAVAGICARLPAFMDKRPGAKKFAGGQSEIAEQVERGQVQGCVIDIDGWGLGRE